LLSYAIPYALQAQKEDDMADVASDVLEVIAKQAKVEPAKVARETELADLNLESLDTIELIFALEEKFNIEIPFNANEAGTAGISFTTAGDVIDAVAKLVAEQEGGKA
jgi:acyl carrier protein